MERNQMAASIRQKLALTALFAASLAVNITLAAVVIRFWHIIAPAVPWVALLALCVVAYLEVRSQIRATLHELNRYRRTGLPPGMAYNKD